MILPRPNEELEPTAPQAVWLSSSTIAPRLNSGALGRRQTILLEESAKVKTPWRGFVAIASWLLWPIVYFSAYWLLSVALATGRRCSIEGCDPPDGLAGALWFLGMLAVPVWLTYRWLKWRR